MSEGKEKVEVKLLWSWKCSEVNLGLEVGRGDERRVYLQGNAWLTGYLLVFRCSSNIKLELQG